MWVKIYLMNNILTSFEELKKSIRIRHLIVQIVQGVWCKVLWVLLNNSGSEFIFPFCSRKSSSRTFKFDINNNFSPKMSLTPLVLTLFFVKVKLKISFESVVFNVTDFSHHKFVSLHPDQ